VAAAWRQEQPKFAKDIQQIQQNFPVGSIQSAHSVNADELLNFFSCGPWDIVHLAMFVNDRGDLLIPDPDDHESAARKVIPAEGVEKLVSRSSPRLVVIVTCDSLVLAARVARYTNTIAGHRPIHVGAALNWSVVFYPALAHGCPSHRGLQPRASDDRSRTSPDIQARLPSEPVVEGDRAGVIANAASPRSTRAAVSARP
jgi:hypothetical protein